MALDNAKNFCKVTVSTGYTSTDTSIDLVSGDGAKLPTPPFNLVWYNDTDYPDVQSDPNKEIVRVTAVSGDTLTIARGQEGTTAVDHNLSGKTYKMINTITKKMIDDINNHITDTSNPHNVTTSQIGALSNASNSLSIYFAKNHRFIIIPSYSADDWTESVSGTASINYNPIWIFTGTTANSYVNVRSGAYLKNIPSSSMMSFFLMATSSLTNTNIYIGVTDSSNKIDGTQNFVGFHVNDGKVYAMCSNGNNTTEIDTGDTFIDIYDGLVGSFYSTDSGVDFYNRDSILKAHITTNLPLSLYNGRFVIQIENLDATNRSVLLYKIFAID